MECELHPGMHQTHPRISLRFIRATRYLVIIIDGG
jgi:hypothetical protein